MKKFETGKTYKINGNGYIHINRRTEHFAEIYGVANGKELFCTTKKIYKDDLFGLGEHILLPAAAGNHKMFTFAAHEITLDVIYDDPEGTWKVLDITDNFATVIQIQNNNLNYGREFVVPFDEVKYYAGL